MPAGRSRRSSTSRRADYDIVGTGTSTSSMNSIVDDVVSGGVEGTAVVAVGSANVDAVNEPMSTAEGQSLSLMSSTTTVGIGTVTAAPPSESTPPGNTILTSS